MSYNFCYISKRNPEVQKAYNNVVSLIKEVQNLVRKDFTFRFDVVGSYKRNMITYDFKSNVGFDFDFNIEVNDDNEKFSEEKIRNIIRQALNKIVKKYGYDYPEDSTRVLTIKVKDKKNSRILHSCDFAIVNNYSDVNCEGQQYIRFNKKHNTYEWCEQGKGYYMLEEKVEWIKESDLWGELRNLYIKKKNINYNPYCRSRAIFAMAVHEICQKYGFIF